MNDVIVMECPRCGSTIYSKMTWDRVDEPLDVWTCHCDIVAENTMFPMPSFGKPKKKKGRKKYGKS